jgi:hypothetical protein
MIRIHHEDTKFHEDDAKYFKVGLMIISIPERRIPLAKLLAFRF